MSERIEAAARTICADRNGPRGRSFDAHSPEWQDTYRQEALMAWNAFHPIITTTEELDALPEGTLILAPNTNPRYPSVFQKCGGNQWLALDPGDRHDGEDTIESAVILRWESKDNTATVLWIPQVTR